MNKNQSEKDKIHNNTYTYMHLCTHTKSCVYYLFLSFFSFTFCVYFKCLSARCIFIRFSLFHSVSSLAWIIRRFFRCTIHIKKTTIIRFRRQHFVRSFICYFLFFCFSFAKDVVYFGQRIRFKRVECATLGFVPLFITWKSFLILHSNTGTKAHRTQCKFFFHLMTSVSLYIQSLMRSLFNKIFTKHWKSNVKN